MELLMYTLKCIAGTIVTSPLVFILIILLIILYLKNKKIVTMQKIIIGGSVDSSIELTLSQFVLGIIGGAIGSIILTNCGVIFSKNSGIEYLFLTSILLMFIKPKYICFSYSSFILGSVSIFTRLMHGISQDLFNWPPLDIDIVYLMMFIAVFHIVEGFLVMIDGHRGSMPVFTKHNNKILGGYAFKRYWILPIALLMVTGNSSSLRAGTYSLVVNTPDWWPLIQTKAGMVLIGAGILSLAPFYAIVGYSSVSFSRSKKSKSLSSGLSILIYGVVLACVAQVARFGLLGEISVIIFAPVAHEFMLRIQRVLEEKREAKFVSDENGLVVLDIAKTSPLKDINLKIGEKILTVNDKNIDSEKDIYKILKEHLNKGVFRIQDMKNNIREVNYTHIRGSRLGVSLVPRFVEADEVVKVSDESFKNILTEIKNAHDREHDKSAKGNNKDK